MNRLFPGPNFWKGLLDHSQDSGSRKFSPDCWDRIAQSYDDLEKDPGYTLQVKKVLEKMKGSGALNKEYTLLDVACGTGTYATIFAPYLKRVTGLDISAGMLKRFKEKIMEKGIENCELIHQDWQDYLPETPFDIVFSSMTPLLSYYKNIDKMVALARHFLVLVGWAGIRENPFLDKMTQAIFGKGPGKPKSDITLVFAYLYSLGYSPEIEYFIGTWKRTYEIKKQLEKVAWHLEFRRRLTKDERHFIRRELEKLATNGMVTLETRVRTGIVLLRMKDYGHPGSGDHQ